jgi:hypothetical protein
MNPRLATALLSAALLRSPVAAAQNDPRYLTQVRAELQAMGFAPQCAAASPQAGTCRLRARAEGEPASTRQFTVVFDYSDVTDTIYVYLDRYATLRAEGPEVAAAQRRLLEMNWEMLVGKFEWSPTQGEVRLGTVLHTDSNFDRRAFRGAVRALLRVGERYADEVSRLTAGPVGEPLAPSGAAPSMTPLPAR